MLHNKGKIWDSDEKWIFKRQTIDLIYIENILTKKVLEFTNDDLVSQEDYVKGKLQQLWKKGDPNAEGYFTLETSTRTKMMTANTSRTLIIKGNITLKKNSYYLLTFYNVVFFTYRS